MKNWKIGTRIATGFALLTLIVVVLGLYSCKRMIETRRSETLLAEKSLPSVRMLSGLQMRVILEVDAVSHAIRTDSFEEKQQYYREIDDWIASSGKDLRAYEALPTDTEETILYDKVKTERIGFLSILNKVRRVSEDTHIPAVRTHAIDLGNTELRDQRLRYLNAIQDLVNYNVKNCFQGLGLIQTTVRSSEHGALVGIALAMACALPLSIFTVRSITLPLSRAVQVLDQVGKRNLSVSLDVDSDDEIGQMAKALNGALRQLRGTLREVTSSARSVTTSSLELAAAAESIASGSQQQAASLEETSSSLEEMTATVRQSSDNAHQANQLAVSSRDAAQHGQEVVADAVTAMKEINQSSSRIAEIISTIDEIAFQTNLLAVNAAVEAARAGEEGRGFAVVATEVRSLAQRSAGAAKEIKGLIQDSLRKVERGSDLVNRSGETLQGIMTSVKRVADIVGEISAAAEEESTGIDQVNTAVTQIDQVTQANSAQTEELSATAQSLSQQSGHLLKIIGVFTLQKEGDDAVPESGDPHFVPPFVPRNQGKAAARKSGFSPLRPAMAGAMLATASGPADTFEEF